MTEPTNPVLEAAREYRARGWVVVPVGYRQKKPSLGSGWPKKAQAIHDDELPRLFPAQSNIGVLLGSASRHLVDIDLDCPEALELAPVFLPPTLIFGRHSAPRSHWLYVSEAQTAKHVDPRRAAAEETRKKATVVELRSDATDGPGLQSVFPPSTHEDTGEAIAWEAGASAPLVIAADALTDQVASLAAACLALRYAPDATRAWLAGGRFPDLPQDVAPTAREWLGIPPKRAPVAAKTPTAASIDFAAAAVRYNRDHARTYPTHMDECPICGSPDGFKQFKDNPDRWVCFSSRHLRGGLHGKDCFHGDALALDAHAAGLGAAELLRRKGYLK